MRRLVIVPALLFGLGFAGGGYFIAAETAVPMWQNWQRAQDWRPAYARLLSVAGNDNGTIASYEYDYGGASYRGQRVGVSEFNDNIGSWQRDTQARLREVQRSGELLPIGINPANPAESIVDRDMRWGLFALIWAFCSIFIFIGVGVIYASIRTTADTLRRDRPSFWEMRKTWQQARSSGKTDLGMQEFCEQHYAELATERAEASPAAAPVDWQGHKGWESPEIKSDAGKGAWFFWLFALLWNAISSPILFILPAELQRQNYAAAIALLFPAVGLWLLYMAIKRSLEYRHFGRVLLHMDPYPGSIGGHVGGRLQVDRLDHGRVSAAKDLKVTLECVYSYISGSGKNRSRRESIKWAEQGRPQIVRSMQGVNLVFRFDVPAGLPQADVRQTGAYHFWRLGIKADIPGIDLERSYNIPVFATAESSHNVRHDISAQVAATRKHESDAAKLAIASGRFDIEGLSRALRFRNEGNRILMQFPMFRNRMLTLFAAVFAGGFGFACYSMADMASAGGLFGAFMLIFGLPFFLVALLATIATIYLPLNNLRVEIESGSVSVLRCLLFIPIYRRRLQHNDISHLSIKRSGSTGAGVNKVEHFKVRAEDKQGGQVTLAEDIDGEDVATHLRDYLAQRIGVSTR